MKKVVLLMSFNSLQTGKHIQSVETLDHIEIMEVSIPFKRESIYKVP